MTAPTLLEGAPALAWLAAKLTTAIRPGSVALVAVDGRAGSGKSTFALRLSGVLNGAPILPLDDFLSWDDLTEFWPRFETDALAPLFAGKEARYQARDWEHDPYGRGLGPWKSCPPSPVVILEGVGAARRELRSRLALSIWMETPPLVCRRRGILRDGPDSELRWARWQERETAFFDSDPVQSYVDLVVDGGR